MAALLIGCFIMRLRNRKPSLQEVFLERSSHSLWQALIFFPEVKGYIHSPTDIQFHIFFGGGSSRPYPIGRRLVITVVKTRGAFHSSKTSGLNFLQLPVTNRTAFPKFLKKKTISRGRPKFFTKFVSWKFSFHSTLLPEFLRSFSWIVYISEIQQLLQFLEIFCTICCCFQVFEKVLTEWKAPKVLKIIWAKSCKVGFKTCSYKPGENIRQLNNDARGKVV